MRSGFVAGDAVRLASFLTYRTYHGCAMPPHHQAASIAAWRDEDHVVANRALYREKIERVQRILAPALPCAKPAGAFYLWAETPGCDQAFAKALYAATHVTVLPGSFLSHAGTGGDCPDGVNPNGQDPGAGLVRVALVAPLGECVEAAKRIAAFTQTYQA